MEGQAEKLEEKKRKRKSKNLQEEIEIIPSCHAIFFSLLFHSLHTMQVSKKKKKKKKANEWNPQFPNRRRIPVAMGMIKKKHVEE